MTSSGRTQSRVGMGNHPFTLPPLIPEGDRQREGSHVTSGQQENPFRLIYLPLPWSLCHPCQQHPLLFVFCCGHVCLCLTSHNSMNILLWEILPPLMDVGLVGALMERSSKEGQ